MPTNNGFKSYMDYRTITDMESEQYKMQKIAYTNNEGLRKIDDYYCVAMGTYYGVLGDKLLITTETGVSYKVIISEIKSDKHTDSTRRYTVLNGCITEFIVDVALLPYYICYSGNVSNLGFTGAITEIVKI